MAIAKADILTAINGRLNRAETNIDLEIIEAVEDLGRRGNFLAAADTMNTVANISSYAEPTLLRGVKELTIIGASDPLDEISYTQWLRLMSSTVTREPKKWARWNGKFYLHPIPDAIYAITRDHWLYHGSSADAITFADKYGTAVKLMCCHLVSRNLGLDQAKMYYGLYEGEVEKLRSELPTEPGRVRYSDI